MKQLYSASDKTVIQCATLPEVRALEEVLGRPEIRQIGRRRYVERDSVIVVRGSVGKVWAAASAEFAINQWTPKLVVDFGAAGALRGELKTGDLVIADQVIEHDWEAAEGLLPPVAVAPGFASDVAAFPTLTGLADGIRATRGAVASGDRDIQTVGQRSELAARTGAVAATWESSAIGRVCAFHGVPYVSVRVITDVGGEGSGAEFLEEYKKGASSVLVPAARALFALLAK